MQSRFYTLTDYPTGLPKRELFSLETQELPELADGEVRIRNHWLSVDPYMRGRMSGIRTYVAPFELGQPMEGGAIGEVIASKHADVKVGDKVSHMGGWRDIAQVPGDGVTALPDSNVPDQAYLGVLGMPGMTAWTGLNLIAECKPGDNVLVSAASGAVGSLAVQLAKAKGCHVVGIAGAAHKLAWLESLGVEPVSYRDRSAQELSDAIKLASPNGIDVYYENVGGICLEAALSQLNEGARIAVCGMIDSYNAETPTPGPSNLSQLVVRKAKMQGFIVADHWSSYRYFLNEVAPQVADGKLDYKETIKEGLESTPDAFLALFEGGNTGKMLVKLSA
ncbi:MULTISPECIES: NADP-dependent oxidoreductase [unclassified Halomonas]|uniref:NADP-dependent oxidoreductase n=1 Tax=unclassified Halomonas TaxID=2609666 RepID=UPI001EF3F94A|nr:MULTISPECIES: NADP-dependent oxidoreductase [unclassified Halomonas]MCG7577097.1 NADP-dependent oxidoreductase [Halomonas sp. MMH1-48]MCG7604091.1 NADP-dependent oxidoreductase [Halomonas sp. MM17-34]MCG7613341.1 NADP-dependent oxidoreductase [Halomonas sp. MM17-29]MCG7620185.1 NADP-dependent oxidoreductase [Halomonas sp. DSH1-27]